MRATTGSLLLDECNIACSLNYGAALTRGISENVDKMNMVPRFPFAYEFWEAGAICIAGDMTRRILVSVLATPSLTALEMFIIVINILSGSGGGCE